MSTDKTPSKRPLVKMLLVALLPFAGVGACQQLDEIIDPGLVGPSEQAVSIDLRAVPNLLNADGVSTSTITIRVRNQDGAPVANRQLFVQQTSGDGAIVAASGFIGPLQGGFSIATASDGSAQLLYQAGTFAPTRVWIRVRAYSIDASGGGEPDHWIAIDQI